MIAPVLFVAGGAWTTGTVTLNVSTQRALPWWVRARGLGLYMLVLSGGIALGSALWGAIAGWSIPAAYLVAAATLLAGTVTARRWRLMMVYGLDLRPSTPTEPIVTLEPDGDDGPVLVTVAYRVPAHAQGEFTVMMRRVERDRRRNGATQWELFRDLADTDRFLETFVVDTWAEHRRQHQRRTVTADVVMRRARQYVEGDVVVSHFVSAYSPHGLDAPPTAPTPPSTKSVPAG